MADFKTQVVGLPFVYELKPQGITEIEVASEYFPINDEIPVDTTKPQSTVANVNEIYKTQVIDKAIVTPIKQTMKPETTSVKSKLPWVAGLVGAYFLFKN